MSLVLAVYAGRPDHGWGWLLVVLLGVAYYSWREAGGGQSQVAKWIGWALIGVLVLWATGLWLLFM